MKKNKDKFNKELALDFESSKKDLIERSNKRAWLVAFISVFISVLLVIAIFLMLPLKTVELRVIKVDKNGYAEIVTELDLKTIKTDEATDKHYIALYVKTREQYYYETLSNDYAATQSMSNEFVKNSYLKIYDGSNGRAERLENRKFVEAKILSIVLSNSNGTKVATVRAEMTKRDKSTYSVNEKAIKVITLSYEYLPTKQTEKIRLTNPLGFTVTSYRIDNEVK